LTYKSVRCFGAGGPDNSNHTYVTDKVDSQQTNFKIPSKADIEY